MPTGLPLVVQVAQLVPHKDPLNFVRAIAAARERVPSLQALLVGDGPLWQDVADAVRTLGLEGSLHAVGYRDDADALLAGVRVRVGDDLYESSVAGQLQALAAASL